MIVFQALGSFQIINSSWNWDGKIYGMAWGLIMYVLFCKQFVGYDFFTFRQCKKGLKSAVWVAIALVSYSAVSGIVGNKEYDLETLLFQLSMPGIEEELIFRGVLLGLMCSMLRYECSEYRNPAVIINGILLDWLML